VKEYAVVGKGLPRVDAYSKATGAATFTVDISLPGMLHGKILRSPYPHARILGIDTSRALCLPGVKAILTGQDVSGIRIGFVNTPRYPADQSPLAQDKVRYVGDEVAAVAAVDEDTALEALELIKVDYEPLPAVYTIDEALEPDAAILHEVSYDGVSAWEDWGQKRTTSSRAEYEHPNISGRTSVAYGDVDRAFAEAYLVRQDRFETVGTAHCPMEPHSCVADYDASGKLNVYLSGMAIFYKRFMLAKALGMPTSKIRVVKTYVGGAYGGKIDIFPYEVAASLLSMRTGRPVKIELTREEVFTTTRQRHPARIDLRTGVSKDGLILGQEVKFTVDNGAYRGSGPVVIFLGFAMNNPVYSVPNFRYEGYSIYTNNPIRGPHRGHGAPQMRFAVDSQLHMIAEELGLDPAEVMLKNARHKGDVVPSIGDTLNSCGLSDAIIRSVNDSRWKEIRADSTRKDGLKRRGVGLSTCAMFSGSAYYPFGSAAVVKLHDDGSATLFTGATEFGQGIETTLAQVAAEELGLSLADMTVISGDTELCPIDIGNFLSAGALVSGNAARLAAKDAMGQLLRAAANMLEASPEDLEARNKRIYVKGSPHKSVTYAQAIHTSVVSNNGDPIIGRGHWQAVQGVDRNPSLAKAKGRWTDAYGFAAQVAEVEVDVETGHVELVRATTYHDCGYPLNRQIVEGQIHGCMSHGQGQALSENVDMREGQLMDPSFLTYRIPTSLDCQEMKDGIVESIEPKGPFGAKEVGEGALAGMLGAIANAVYDATGARVTTLPITPDKILDGMKKSRTG